MASFCSGNLGQEVTTQELAIGGGPLTAHTHSMLCHTDSLLDFMMVHERC